MSESYEFVQIVVKAEDRGSMDERGIVDICDANHLRPVEEVGEPPFHPNCRCEVVEVIRPKGE